MLGLLGIGNFLGHVYKVWRALRFGSLTLNSVCMDCQSTVSGS